ncbi:16S rRNA (cytosine(1402)-N(4))-methyltransferase RsmH [Pelovirga terrestris]|uniref:Ribosomal RNA small subunit methyltransferase H n=1 Tax=Pelovirga terrestris TaxID=2771352 RepID=A0A8J6R5C9_9BACT|nr:16S rRNA (cytosine(1402)-N(4))-methyltransferase RsmH [Pelovirga terrestris]MBD1400149.1 16S rRNA (cytosine(1402)-N(4))-methyltransferase RsmH [Pelovirga terrestris]
MVVESYSHLPVLPEEVIHWLDPQPGGVFLDGTLGGAGHARLILDRAPGSRLIGVDRDPAALAHAAQVLAPYGDRVSLHHAEFDQAAALLAPLGITGLDGMLLDLGVSSHQLDTPERGFSFRHEAPLDMRMNPQVGMTAAEVVNQLEEGPLRQLFFDLGEERYSRRIAARIVAQRRQAPITTTTQLADLVRDVVPGGHRPDRIHPATRVFQALRIYVNDELGQVKRGVVAAIDLLKPGGRLVVISFHSLEDRIVKQLFRARAQGCICPPRLPVCQCRHQPEVELLTRKGIKAAAIEIEKNQRSRSAILRAVKRCR